MNAVVPPWRKSREKSIIWQDWSILGSACAGLTGREFLEAIADGRLPQPPLAELIATRLAFVGDGEAKGRPSERRGRTHAPARWLVLDRVTVSYLKPLRADGGDVPAHGKTLHFGGPVAFDEADACTTNGDLVGHAISTIAAVRVMTKGTTR